jgi:DNA-binding LacI/PurR family transcriptional regulator
LPGQNSNADIYGEHLSMKRFTGLRFYEVRRASKPSGKIMPTTVRTNRRVTLKDIAQSVGVSVNAASKVLNNTRSNAYVSQDTRKRILDTAGAMGYQPNFAARSLTRRRTDVMALYFNRTLSLAEPFTAALIEGAEDGCQDYSQSLLIYSRRKDESLEDVCRKVLSGMADGIAIDYWTPTDVIDRFIQAGLPMVMYPHGNPEIPSIVIDEQAAAIKAVKYLADKGHKSMYYRSYKATDEDRSRVYRRAAAEFGIEFRVIADADEHGTMSEEEKHLLALPRDQRPTAAACWNDVYAYKLIDYCETVGIKVPADLAVVGFDGVRTFPERKQKLTTIYVPWIEIAKKAISLLVDIRDGRPVPNETSVELMLDIGETA